MLLFNSVNYVFLLCLCVLNVMFMYSYYVCSLLYILFSLFCSVYCLCVNVYCTTATGCQPNLSEIYRIMLIYYLTNLYILMFRQLV
jgi:hypothetical protein